MTFDTMQQGQIGVKFKCIRGQNHVKALRSNFQRTSNSGPQKVPRLLQLVRPQEPAANLLPPLRETGRRRQSGAQSPIPPRGLDAAGRGKLRIERKNMDIAVDGLSYHVAFRQSEGTGITSCFFTPEPGGPEFVAETQCSRTDAFDAREGKKIALIRAMRDEARLDEETTLQIWVKYLRETKDPCLLARRRATRRELGISMSRLSKVV
jgi:hypothetical protein